MEVFARRLYEQMKIELELEEIRNIQNLIISRVNELREKISNDIDREEEIKEIIRYYKKLVKKIENQI
jgi:predicted KAP-like P-loop ATPase